MSNIAVLGPEYSNSHLLGTKIFPDQAFLFCSRMEEIFKAVTEKKVKKGIIPIENMLQGSVRESILSLLKYKVKINQAYTMPIHHCLAAKRINYTKIISHPQALAQCSHFVEGKEIKESTSTSEAMELAAKDEALAAIGSREAAQKHELNLLQENIEDNHDNVTRFLVISLEETAATKKAQTSLLLKPREDRPGLLFHLLAPFAVQNINLLKIESLPTGKKMGEYAFYVEIDGNVQEERVKTALNFLSNSVDIYSLGSYHVADLK